MQKLENFNITNLTTMRVNAIADLVFFPDTPEELITLIYQFKEQNLPWSILGAGSNTLISSRGVRSALIITSCMDWITKNSQETISVGPGLRLPKFAGNVAQMGLSGCEFYEGIPGSVGGAIIMNAGAHGTNTSNILEKIVVLDTKKMEVKTFFTSQLEFAYRKSGIDPNRYIILEAKFRLKPGRITAQIQSTMREYNIQRVTKQPKGFSSGCIFRNPNAILSAGMLIDEMGFKGEKLGGAEVSKIHANFIMNASGASSDNVCNLMHRIQNKLWSNRKIWLQPEVQPLGEFEELNKIIWLHPDQRPEGWQELLQEVI